MFRACSLSRNSQQSRLQAWIPAARQIGLKLNAGQSVFADTQAAEALRQAGAAVSSCLAAQALLETALSELR